MDRFYTYRGDLRAAVGVGANLWFVTAHPEGQPTAVYRIDTESDGLTEYALPCGGVAVACAGETIVAAGADGRLYAVTDKGTKPFAGPFDAPAALTPVAGDRLAVVAGKSLVIVARADGRLVQTLSLAEVGTCVAADPTGQWLAVGGDKGAVSVFDGQDKPEFEPADASKLHDGAVTAILFEPDELRFFSVGADNKLLTTHARGSLEPEDKGRGNAHADAATALLYLPGGDRIVTGGRDKAVKNWPRAGAIKPGTVADKVGQVVALALVTPHGQPTVAVLCDDASIRFLPVDPADGRFADDLDDIDTVRGALAWADNELAVTYDGKRREQALQTLADWNDAPSLDLIARQVGRDADSAVRVAAAILLGWVKNPRAVTLLEPLVGHADDKVRVAAFEGLRIHLGPADPRPIGLALDTGQANVGVLAAAALEPSARADDQALAKLVAALDAPTWDVRRRAVAALEAVFGADADRATLTALGAARGDVRALALGRAFDRKLLGMPAVLAAVRRRLEDDDGAVRKMAFLLLVEARPALAVALRARDAELHRQLAELERSEAKPPPAVSGAASGLADADRDVLLQAASSRALDTCLRGATGLARLADPRAFPLLLQLSREEPEYARVEVCRALAALGDGRATARLRSLLLDPQPGVRDAAYTAVAQLSAADPLAAAEAGLTAAHEDVRRRGLQTLLTVTKSTPPATDSDAGWGLFVRALNDPAAAVRREAFKAALNQGVATGGEGALRFALRSVHADVRREVLTEVQAQAAAPWAVPLLYEFFDDPAAELRSEAFELATRKTKELAPLEAALRSKYADARLLAVDALFKKHSKAAQGVLLRATADPDAGVRGRAVAALVDDDARGPLAAALGADHPDVRVRAAAALARFGDPAALPVLRAAAFAPEPAEAYKVDDWRRLAADALAGLRLLADAGVFPDLVALLDSPHDVIRANAAAALVTCTPADGTDAVRRALAHADPAVRFQAALALAARGDATVHPMLFGDGGRATDLDKLAALVAADPPNPAALAGTLDAADEAARRPALSVHLLLERAGTDGVPDLLLQALSAKAPRVRLAAAEGLEAFADPAGFAAFVAKSINDRGDDPAWKLGADVFAPLAAVLAFAPPVRRFEAARLLGALADKEPARFVQEWAVFARRYVADVAAAVARLKLVPAALTPAELRELAFGAYVGLVREQGSGGSGAGVVRVRQTALARISAIAAADAGYARAARPVFTQALGDPNQPVRGQAFDHLQALGLPKAELGAEALEAGHTDLGVRGLELLTDGTSSRDGQAVLERVMLTRTDELATEAAKLLAKARGTGPVATVALEAVSEPLRAHAVAWLAEAFDADPAAKQALRGAVTSRYRRVREDAALALAGKKDAAAFDTLATLLREATDAGRQGRLIEAFAALGDPRAVGVLLDRIETDPTGTAAADELFQAAGAFRLPASADRLLAMAAARKEWRGRAFDAVHVVSGFDTTFPDPDADLAAFEKAEKDWHPLHPAILARLIEAVVAAGEIGDRVPLLGDALVARGTDVDPVLASLCAHADEDVRRAAVTVAGWRAKHRGGPVEPLLKAVRHKEPTTQFVAAEGLARVGRAEGLPVLLSGLEYVDDVSLRERAVLALGELADPRAVDALLKLAADDGHALQEAAAEAIGHLRKAARAEEVGKMLDRLARSPRDGVARRALIGLRHFDTVAGWRVIRAKAKDKSWWTRRVACEQLGYDPDPATRPLLLDVLRTESDGDVAGVALDSAVRLFGADSVEPYYAAVENDEAAADPLGHSDLVPVDVVCDRGDPLRLLDLFPRCSPEVKERLEASLTGRPAVPVAEATAALGHAHDATVRLAARLLAGATNPPPASGQALAAALQKWRVVWNDRRAAFDRTGDRAPLDRATACLQALLWAASRLGAAGDAPADLATARPDDPLAKPVRLDALRTLASVSPLAKRALAALETLAGDADADVRTLAAAVLAAADPGRAAALLAGHLSDRPTFARVVAAGVQPGDVTRAAAGKPHQQSVVLPALAGAKDISTLAAVASDRQAAEPARLGAVEGLGFMADVLAEAQLTTLATAAGDDEDVRKAAWKALRRSRRARRTIALRATPNGAGG